MAVNCRAILRAEHGKSPEENFKILLGKFRKKTTDSGVMTLWKQNSILKAKVNVAGERQRKPN